MSANKVIHLIEETFSACFLTQFKTLLIGGAEEPLYMPSETGAGLNRLYYREDYVSSALHESAHWCLAGDARREKIDFGYWYIPEGRSAKQQANFQTVEARPQALEWLLSIACNSCFHLSLDNCGSQENCNFNNFADSVAQHANAFIAGGLPQRAKLFFIELTKAFNTDINLSEIKIQTNLLI